MASKIKNPIVITHIFTSTIIRRKRNKIERLKIEGNWIDDSNIVKTHIINHFKILFSADLMVENIINFPPNPKLNDRDIAFLDNIPNDIEIKKGIFSMEGLKAIGPDRVQPLFYQKHWEIVKKFVCSFVKKCFMKNEFPNHLNKSLITFIPKIDNPKLINQFRTITLCNVIDKVVIKVIFQMIRLILDKIVGPFQSSFMPGRQTMDNIIISQEIIHTLMNKKGKSGGMVLKIDLEKAYDRVNWSLLVKVLQNFNFSTNFIKLIMSCVAQGKTSIFWNCEKTNSFAPSRGLRQGDPLSPYLFVRCYEYLSNLINTRFFQKNGYVLRFLGRTQFSHIYSLRIPHSFC